MGRLKRITAGDNLDRILRTQHQESIGVEPPYELVSVDKLQAKQRAVADLARIVVNAGNFKAYVEDGSYERMGTWFVKLDFNRYVSARELPKENLENERRIVLKIMEGEKEPSEPKTVAVFHDDDSIDLGVERITYRNLEDLREVLEFVSNNIEK